jgi:hypothetical protein
VVKLSSWPRLSAPLSVVYTTGTIVQEYQEGYNSHICGAGRAVVSFEAACLIDGRLSSIQVDSVTKNNKNSLDNTPSTFLFFRKYPG